jgi:uncharacterized protein (TIGR02421 family)
VYDTANSYLAVAELRRTPGSADFHRASRAIYGGPDDPLPGSELTHLDAAERLLEATAALSAATRDHDDDYRIVATEVAKTMRRRLDAFFEHDAVRVVIDDDLAAKAAASATRIRLRGGSCFSANDIEQLIEHEAFIHSATALNGRKQHGLRSLGLGAPRTTATQEGLATFAELITDAMDLARLRRIALRVRAVHLAEEGADFVEVFRHVHEAGQSEQESVHTTLRIFRGADPNGGSPFTKDVVYLRGLIAVSTFLRLAIAQVRPDLVFRLFAGRLALGDVLALDEAFAEGDISEARYVPAWAKNIQALAAFLSLSALLQHVDLCTLSLDTIDA